MRKLLFTAAAAAGLARAHVLNTRGVAVGQRRAVFKIPS